MVYRRFRFGNDGPQRLYVTWRNHMDAVAPIPLVRAGHRAAAQPHLPPRLAQVHPPLPEQANQEYGQFEVRDWNPDKRKVANVLEAMEALGALERGIDPPAWIFPHSAAETDAAQMISCENGLLDLSTRTIHDHSPALFNVVSVPFAYDENAPGSHRMVGVPGLGLGGRPGVRSSCCRSTWATSCPGAQTSRRCCC